MNQLLNKPKKHFGFGLCSGLLITSFFFLLNSCSAINKINGLSSTPNTNGEKTNSLSLSLIPNSLQSTKTSTVKITPLPTQTFTLTPLPTIPDSEADKKFTEWLNGYPNCLLPCWAGIMPGVTNWEAAKRILSPILKITGDEENFDCKLGKCNELFWQSRSTPYVDGEINSRINEDVYSIIIEGKPPSPLLRVDEILTNYGVPEKVLLEFVPYTTIPMDLILAYPEKQFAIKYQWEAETQRNVQNGGENGVSCIQTGRIYLVIKGPDFSWTDESLLEEMYPGGISLVIKPKPVEVVTNMTVQKFYEEFKSIEGNECIITPIKYWSP
jgi:hypothetical protein